LFCYITWLIWRKLTVLATTSSHTTGAKHTPKKLTDRGWETDYSTFTLEVETHFYTENQNFGN